MTESALAVTARGADIERTLVTRSAEGDREAYDQLLSERLEGLYHTALGILRVDADAQDAVQDACVQAWRHLRSLREPERFDAWIARILINSCRERLRKRRRTNVREIDISIVDDSGQEALSGARVDQRVVEIDAIRRAFERLKPDERLLLALHHADRRSVEDIAMLLEIPTGTAKWRLFAARQALATALERER